MFTMKKAINSETMSNFAHRLRELRLAHKLSQQKLAKKISIST